MDNIFELTPKNGRKSFNGKAKVIVEDDIAKLLSYETIVAQINLKTNEYTENGEYSATTNIHIKHFKDYYGV